MSPGRADLGSHVGCQASHFRALCLRFLFCQSETAHPASAVVVGVTESNTQKAAHKGPVSTASPVLSTYCSLSFGRKDNWQVALRLGMTRPRPQGSDLLVSFSFPELFRASQGKTSPQPGVCFVT